jgi:hypothetical protein
MQLDSSKRPPVVLGRLRAAACLLLAVGAPSISLADGSGPKYQFDASGLLYGEAGRAKVVEPTARITRLFDGGASLGAQFALDVITGASPTGARPIGGVQTVTTPSGRTQTVSAGELPTTSFHDVRKAVDLDWQQPIGSLFSAATGGHFSTEKDYRSVGISEKLSLETMHRLTTWTVGGGYNRDAVFPVGGTPVGLTSGGVLTGATQNSKQVASALVGVSRVLTRRWLVALNASHMVERGYLTEPYKVVSVLDPTTQNPVGSLTELRPDTRQRSDVLASSVYHLARDVLYTSYRYYWDDWGVQSSTLDIKYRSELQNESFLQPHFRLYTQSAADFFTLGLMSGAPLPEFATSDQRLSHFNSVTLGLTYGFKVPGQPGEFTVRGEYIGQFGHLNLGPTQEEEGAPVTPDAFPPLNIGTLTASYSVSF